MNQSTRTMTSGQVSKGTQSSFRSKQVIVEELARLWSRICDLLRVPSHRHRERINSSHQIISFISAEEFVTYNIYIFNASSCCLPPTNEHTYVKNYIDKANSNTVHQGAGIRSCSDSLHHPILFLCIKTIVS